MEERDAHPVRAEPRRFIDEFEALLFEQPGCDGAVLRLLNRDNLSGKGSPGNLGGDLQSLPAPGGCEVLTAPAVRKSGRIDQNSFAGTGWGTSRV